MYIYIGKTTGVHGLKGELKLKSDFIYIDKVLKKGFNIYAGDNREKLELESFRRHNKFILIAFKGLLDINKVEHLRNKNMYVMRDDLNLADNEYTFDDYIGLDCYYNDKKIGVVEDIVDSGNNNYIFYIVGDKEILIPVNDIFISKVILNDKIVFKDVEGLIDAN